MDPAENKFDWRIGYAVFCLLYAGTLIYLGQGNFDKVYGEYRQAVYRLQPTQIEKITFAELASECRAEQKRKSTSVEQRTLLIEKNCQSFPVDVLENRQKTVTQQLQIEKKRFQRKLIVFYFSFALFFLALPLYLLFLLLKFLVWVFKDVKISK